MNDVLQYSGTIPKLDLIISGLKTREHELKMQKMNENSDVSLESVDLLVVNSARRRHREFFTEPDELESSRGRL